MLYETGCVRNSPLPRVNLKRKTNTMYVFVWRRNRIDKNFKEKMEKKKLFLARLIGWGGRKINNGI